MRFRIEDVFLPGPEGLFAALPEGTELEGVVRAFSDAGSATRFFALVEIAIVKTVVVPVGKLKLDETKSL